VVEQLDTISICVPTPQRKTKDPDMSYIVSAVESIAKHLHPRDRMKSTCGRWLVPRGPSRSASWRSTRAPAWAALHSDRPLRPVVEGEAERLRSAVHRVADTIADACASM
jgi:hypothetical protein